MTRAEIARLKEALTADYKRKLEALELVEQMLDQQQKRPSPSGLPGNVQHAKVDSSAKSSGGTIATRIEQAFQKQPRWTALALTSAIGVKHRATLWKPLHDLIKKGKVRISKQGGRGRASEYTRVTR